MDRGTDSIFESSNDWLEFYVVSSDSVKNNRKPLFTVFLSRPYHAELGNKYWIWYPNYIAKETVMTDLSIKIKNMFKFKNVALV